MNRFTTSALIAAGFVAATSANAALTTAADYTFDDASALVPFTQTGAPTVSGGQLQLDGSSYIEIADPLSGATTNYVAEAIVTVTATDTFDFVLARNDADFAGPQGTNNGQGLLIQATNGGQTHVLNSNSGFGTTTQQVPLNTPVALAIVQDGTTSRLFIDGVEVASTTASIIGTPDTLGIGTHPHDGVAGALNGSIDRVRLSTFNAGEFDSADLLLVPEPSSLALLGLSGLMLARRRRG